MLCYHKHIPFLFSSSRSSQNFCLPTFFLLEIVNLLTHFNRLLSKNEDHGTYWSHDLHSCSTFFPALQPSHLYFFRHLHFNILSTTWINLSFLLPVKCPPHSTTKTLNVLQFLLFSPQTSTAPSIKHSLEFFHTLSPGSSTTKPALVCTLFLQWVIFLFSFQTLHLFTCSTIMLNCLSSPSFRSRAQLCCSIHCSCQILDQFCPSLPDPNAPEWSTFPLLSWTIYLQPSGSVFFASSILRLSFISWLCPYAIATGLWLVRESLITPLQSSVSTGSLYCTLSDTESLYWLGSVFTK